MLVWLFVLPLVFSTGLANLVARDGASKVVRVPFFKERNPNHQKVRREPAGKTALQGLDNKDFLFYANVTLGTPEQSLRLHIDTGSSDIWAPSVRSETCQKGACEVGGKYDNTTSSTYQYVEGEFAITYIDGQYTAGEYGKDVFGIGGVLVNDVQFGVGLRGTSEEGILGIGFESRQSRVSRGFEPYPGLITQMVEQNLINSRAYSVWLNDLNAAAGEILFGGIDTGKFEGPLATIPLSRRNDLPRPIDFIIQLNGLTIENAEGEAQVLMNESRAIPALLDTGASFTYLPYDVADQLAQLVGAENIASYKGPAVNCSKRSIEGSVNFHFAGKTIRVNIRDFIIDATEDPNLDFSVLCYFGILGAHGDKVLTLGDTFLRSAYVVYDMDNEAISIGQTIFNSTSTNIMEIGTGTDAVPSATHSSKVDSIVATGTDAASPSNNGQKASPSDSPNIANFAANSHIDVSLNVLASVVVSVLSIAMVL